jgi:signal transduction histidine kinase
LHSTSPPDLSDLSVVAHRSAVYGRIGRWLIHDLRNPTQALTLVTELMDERPDDGDPAVVDTVREATSHVARTLELLDRLLRIPPADDEARPVSVRDSLAFVAALFQTHRSAASLRVDLESADVLPAVRGLQHELDQILLAILLEAMDRLGEREGVIDLRASANVEQVVITLTVEPAGEWLDSERGDGAANNEVAGALAARHGGRLTAAGRAGVMLHLPRWSGAAN